MQQADGNLRSAIQRSFVTLPEEELLLAKRKHWFTLILPLLVTILLGTFFIFADFIIFAFIRASPTLFVSSILTILVVATSFITKHIVDWYFNLYVVTNRKILEVRYEPLFSRVINEVLLDQVRCTEIDAKINGVFNELIDMGDVIVTFDRPTHEEQFMFCNIEDPKQVEAFLEDAFLCRCTQNNVGVNDGQRWFKQERYGERNWRFMQETTLFAH